MKADEAAARLQIALLPGNKMDGVEFNERALHAFERYITFCRDVLAEAGPEVLASIVKTIEQHSRITQVRS